MKVDTSSKKLYLSGEALANPPPGDEVVISGMAGRFPDSDDVEQFANNLYNKVDLVTDDFRRYEYRHKEIPSRNAKMNHITKFDTGFFGIPHSQAQVMDPMCRILLEKTFEALIDAGVNPVELKGTKTGVFLGLCASDSERDLFFKNSSNNSRTDMVPQLFGITGCIRSMLAQRLSYFLQVNGPSYVCDTACSSSLFALNLAYEAIRKGACETAIVGGCNLLLHPMVTLQFARLGVLSMDGSCKSFDDAANGYVRGEGVVVILLQKAKDARRIYAQIVHSKTNCDGYKEQGITYPSAQIQKLLFDEFYAEADVEPQTLSYLEAHGTGTIAGDPEELAAIDAVFCKNRNRPLLIGSVKSNIGHTEPASGVCSVVKCLIGMESGYIPPNINYRKARSGVEGLQSERMIVVTDKIPFPDDDITIGINSFGFGGANAHVLLRSNNKKKVDGGLPTDDLPRLVCLCARTEESMKCFMEDLSERPLDCENLGMLHQIFKTGIHGFNQRGYIVLSKKGVLYKNVQTLDGPVKPVCLVFGDGSWRKLGAGLVKLPAFITHIKRIQSFKIWSKLGINVMNAVTKSDSDNIANETIATVAIETGLYEILKMLNVSFVGFAGTSVGELSAAYADGVLTLEQALLAAYQASINKSPDSLTIQLKTIIKETKKSEKWISKPTDIIKHFVKALLSEEGVFPELPSETILLEIGCTNVRKQNLIETIELIDSKQDDGLVAFLLGLGHLYQTGTDLQLDKIYPVVQWPVSRGTPKIAHLMKWQHSRDYHASFFKEDISLVQKKHRYIYVQVETIRDEWKFIKGHVIDGRLLYAATGYLVLVWETFAMLNDKLMINCKVAFKKVRFNRACTIPSKGKLVLLISIHSATGQFEIIEGDVAVVTGFIKEGDDMDDHWADLPLPAECLDSKSSELTSKDVYKELRLRGYNYKDQFKAIQSYNTKTNTAMVPWTDNWVTFMDNMLQVQILRKDTRSLFVPTRIELVLIDPQKHLSYLESFGQKPIVPVTSYQDLNILRSGGIEFRDMSAASITKRKQGEPVLETYQFIPNDCKLNLESAVRCIIQLAIEILPSLKIKGVELLDEYSRKDNLVLSPIIFAAVSNQPVIQPELFVFSKETVEVDFATVEDNQISLETDCYYVVGTSLLQRPDVIAKIIQSLKQGGFIISREDVSSNPYKYHFKDLMVTVTYNTGKEHLVLLRKIIPHNATTYIKVENENLLWLQQTQKALKSNDDIVLYTKEEFSGILGFTNCLRRESTRNISCFFVDKTFPDLDPNAPCFKIQKDKNLPINVFRDGVWGTYRHLPLLSSREVESNHAIIMSKVRGDLNSIQWVQGDITSDTKNRLTNDQLMVYNYVSSLNFRDIMVASGKLPVETIADNRLEEEYTLGIEYAGRDESGRRVMGFQNCKALSTIVVGNINTQWEIPNYWTMEEAATVPVVYSTVLTGLLYRANMQRGQSILIHSATGGIGLAALNVCIHFGCIIYCTVGTEEKRKFLRENYPQLDQNNVGNSRDTSFEQLIMKRTKGRGVDLVLNSLAEDKQQASLRCVAKGGHFIEIGKVDMANDNPLPLDVFNRQVSFHGVMLDVVFDAKIVRDLMYQGIKQGYVKPLPVTVFNQDEAPAAFRYMTTGKHIGKVVLRTRKPEHNETENIPSTVMIKCFPRVYANPKKVYIIIGGLGGFGLELADWLVMRGAKKILLTSRAGITTGYQSHRINIWNTYGATVKISQSDVTTPSGVLELFKSASGLGHIDGIFNLAVVLQDDLFENQTVEKFHISLNPKAVATRLLDEHSRKLCPTLSYFVVFSSVSCGRGNAGQTNYGMANSVMERICERRKMDGLPGLAIQWGAVGDVGLVADKAEDSIDVVIGGTLQQKIASCLDVLDTFMKQDAPVVSSMVVAEKKAKGNSGDSIVEAVASVMDLDLKSVSFHLTLPELGMDSMMAVELKQMLEREYEVFLTPKDIRSLTLSKLSEIVMVDSADIQQHPSNATLTGVSLLMSQICPEEEAEARFVYLPTQAKHGVYTLICLPGIEGSAITFKILASKLCNCKAVCVQYNFKSEMKSITAMVNYVYPVLEEIAKKEGRFFIAAHSFGSIVALEAVHILLKQGYSGEVFLLDGSPDMLKATLLNIFDSTNEEFLEANILSAVMCIYMPIEEVLSHKAKILECATFEDRIKYAISVSPKNVPHRMEYLTNVYRALYQKINIVREYEQSFEVLDCAVSLFKASSPILSSLTEDYGLANCIGRIVPVKIINGDHATMIVSDILAAAIDEAVNIVSS